MGQHSHRSQRCLTRKKNIFGTKNFKMRIIKAILPSGKIGYRETNIQQRARQRDPLILGKAGRSLAPGVSEPEVISKNPEFSSSSSESEDETRKTVIETYLKDSEMPELTDLTSSNEFTSIEDLSDSSLSSDDDDEIPLVELIAKTDAKNQRKKCKDNQVISATTDDGRTNFFSNVMRQKLAESQTR